PSIEFCSDRGLELHRLYLLSDAARAALDRGRWTEASELAAAVLRLPRASTTPRICALVVLALVRARRGDPEVTPLLDAASALAAPTGGLHGIEPVAAGRAEAAWLAGTPEPVAEATDATLALARDRGSTWRLGELASWRRRAGIEDELPDDMPAPYA